MQKKLHYCCVQKSAQQFGGENHHDGSALCVNTSSEKCTMGLLKKDSGGKCLRLLTPESEEAFYLIELQKPWVCGCVSTTVFFIYFQSDIFDKVHLCVAGVFLLNGVKHRSRISRQISSNKKLRTQCLFFFVYACLLSRMDSFPFFYLTTHKKIFHLI